MFLFHSNKTTEIILRLRIDSHPEFYLPFLAASKQSVADVSLTEIRRLKRFIIKYVPNFDGQRCHSSELAKFKKANKNLEGGREGKSFQFQHLQTLNLGFQIAGSTTVNLCRRDPFV